MRVCDPTHPAQGAPHATPGLPRLGGDELFVPASHVLVIDRHVSHPAFRLWCVLHRLWFLREPPTMEVLQELLGSHATAKASLNAGWQPATRRSIERWLTELEHAGWLVWVRREETTRRYHLRTSARSAPDTAILTELRTLLNSGKATLAEVQALLRTMPASPLDATAGSHQEAALLGLAPGNTTPESHGPIPGSHQDATLLGLASSDATPESHGPIPGSHQDATLLELAPADTTPESHGSLGSITRATPASHHTTSASYHTTLGSLDATLESHLLAGQTADATPGSHDATGGSHHTTAESHDTTDGSHDATPESHHATHGSHGGPADGVLMRQNQPPYREIREREISEDQIPPPPPAASAAGGDDGGGPTTTERYLIRQGFSVKAAREFRALDGATVQADFERRRELGQGIGAIVTTWRVEPPQAESPQVVLPHAQAAADAKAQALTLAPPDASDLEIQYLALDLEDGIAPAVALAHLQARRAGAGGAL